MYKKIATTLMAVTLLLWAWATPGQAQDNLSFGIIAHPLVEVESLSMGELKRLFTKQRSHWDDGTPVVVIELAGNAPARADFYRLVLKKTIDEMSLYWINQTMVHGAAPPVSHGSARRVYAHVARTPGAIAFIPINAPVTAKVKRIGIRNNH